MSRRWWLIYVALLVAVPAMVVWAESVTWNAALEASPTDSDLAANIDNFIRETRTAVRERADTEHAWDDTGGDTTQTGRHREGSARAFFQDAVPTAIAVADADASTALDEGRIWFDSNGGNAIYVYDGTAAAFERVGVALPTNAIILWDQTTGDENCDGTAVADECPCGFVEDEDFRGLFPRGSDEAVADVIVPDSPGTTCSGAAAPAGCDASGGADPDRYNDLLDIAEMPAHDHTGSTITDANTNTNDADSVVADTANAGANGGAIPVTVASQGGGDAHTHPFRSVLFCRAS